MVVHIYLNEYIYGTKKLNKRRLLRVVITLITITHFSNKLSFNCNYLKRLACCWTIEWIKTYDSPFLYKLKHYHSLSITFSQKKIKLKNFHSHLLLPPKKKQQVINRNTKVVSWQNNS